MSCQIQWPFFNFQSCVLNRLPCTLCTFILRWNKLSYVLIRINSDVLTHVCLHCRRPTIRHIFSSQISYSELYKTQALECKVISNRVCSFLRLHFDANTQPFSKSMIIQQTQSDFLRVRNIKDVTKYKRVCVCVRKCLQISWTWSPTTRAAWRA